MVGTLINASFLEKEDITNFQNLLLSRYSNTIDDPNNCHISIIVAEILKLPFSNVQGRESKKTKQILFIMVLYYILF